MILYLDFFLLITIHLLLLKIFRNVVKTTHEDKIRVYGMGDSHKKFEKISSYYWV